MTAENPADTVIEQAVKVIAYHSEHGACMTAECSGDLLPVPYPRNRDDRNAFWDRHIAHALHDAGLMADPTERDEPYDQLDNQRNLWAKQCHEAEARAERAEAEVAELEHRLGDCTCGPWHPDMDGPAEECPRHGRTPADLWDQIEVVRQQRDDATKELDELRATVARVRALADEWEPYGRRPPEYMWASLRTALDGAGEQ